MVRQASCSQILSLTAVVPTIYAAKEGGVHMVSDASVTHREERRAAARHRQMLLCWVDLRFVHVPFIVEEPAFIKALSNQLDQFILGDIHVQRELIQRTIV